MRRRSIKRSKTHDEGFIFQHNPKRKEQTLFLFRLPFENMARPTAGSIFGELNIPTNIYTNDFSRIVLGHNEISCTLPPPPPIPISTHPCLPYRTWNLDPSISIGSAFHDKDGFHVSLDVQQFKQEEVVVKTSGYSVVIEAKKEEQRNEKGYVVRQITRRYELPDDLDMDKIECKLTSDAVLMVKVPKKPPQEPQDFEEKIIPIVISEEPSGATDKPVEKLEGEPFPTKEE